MAVPVEGVGSLSSYAWRGRPGARMGGKSSGSPASRRKALTPTPTGGEILQAMPLDAKTIEAVRGLVQRHHVHFDVREEVVSDGEQRQKLGYRVRLWAVVSGARLLPGDASASLFAMALRAVAEKVIPQERGTTAISIEPTEPALYDSRIVPGADEIAQDILLAHAGNAPADDGEDRCLKAIRKTLESVGAQQRD